MNPVIRLLPAFCLLLSGCTSRDNPRPDATPDLLAVPLHFPQRPDPDYNLMTREGVILGRKLFFEPLMSGNNRIACASCHHQDKAFTDGISLTSIGFSGNRLHRNTQAIINLAWVTNGLFWDGGSTNLESLAIGPITHLDEMGQNILELPQKLAQTGNYTLLFENAFPAEKEEGITTQKILKALGQYLRTVISADSRYDKYILGQLSLRDTEQRGLRVFDSKCSSCHRRDKHLFTDNLYHNIGLESAFSEANERTEQGRYRITFNPDDMGKFRTPTLRNLSYTAPYMHDGRFQTLDEVLDHFQRGIRYTATTSPYLADFSLSDEEKEALKHFLKTLDDEKFVNNPAFRP